MDQAKQALTLPSQSANANTYTPLNSYPRQSKESHSDRIMRRQDDYSRSNRYGGSRENIGPYDRIKELTWHEKGPIMKQNVELSMPIQHEKANRANVSYEQEHEVMIKGLKDATEQQERSFDRNNSTKRLASKIVTPSRVEHAMEDNVTKRSKDITRSLSFTNLDDQEPSAMVEDRQIIDALKDMEIEEQQDERMLECEV